MPDNILDENTKTFEEEPPQKVVEPEEQTVVVAKKAIAKPVKNEIANVEPEVLAPPVETHPELEIQAPLEDVVQAMGSMDAPSGSPKRKDSPRHKKTQSPR